MVFLKVFVSVVKLRDPRQTGVIGVRDDRTVDNHRLTSEEPTKAFRPELFMMNGDNVTLC